MRACLHSVLIIQKYVIVYNVPASGGPLNGVRSDGLTSIGATVGPIIIEATEANARAQVL